MYVNAITKKNVSRKYISLCILFFYFKLKLETISFVFIFIGPLLFRNFTPGEEFEDDPMMIEFSNFDKQRQNPPEELQSKQMNTYRNRIPNTSHAGTCSSVFL